MTPTPRLPRPSELALPGFAVPAARAFLLDTLEQRWQLGDEEVREIDALAAAARARGVLPFAAVHHGNFPTLEYLAHGLKAAQRPTLGIYLLTPPPEATFDLSYGCGGSLARFAYLLAQLGPGALYLQAHGRWCWLGQLVAAVAPQLSVVQEVYDWMDLFVERAHEALFVRDGLFSAAELALNRHAEAHVRTALGGFVYKDAGPDMEALVRGSRLPSVRITPCPPRAWQRPPTPPPAGPWRLVHAGQLKGRLTSRAVFGDLHYLPVIHALTGQGIEVTAFASATPDAAAFEQLYGDYREEARHNPRFHLHANRPVRALIDELHGQHHYGLLTYPLDGDVKVGRPHLRGTVASKLFAYLAAGLPVLVSREAEYMSALVERHGIGLVLDRDDLPRLAQLLSPEAHAAHVAAVARAQDEFCIERWLPQVLGLLDGAARTGGAPAVTRREGTGS